MYTLTLLDDIGPRGEPVSTWDDVAQPVTAGNSAIVKINRLVTCAPIEFYSHNTPICCVSRSFTERSKHMGYRRDRH